MPETPPMKRIRLSGWIDLLGLVTAIALLVILVGFNQPRFVSSSMAQTIANEIPELLVVVVGMTLVLIVGGIDLSVGSVMALSAATIGVAIQAKLPVPLAITCGVLVGTVCGAINGTLSIGLKVPSFIVTLGMLQVARGLTYLMTDSSTIYLGEPIRAIAVPLPGLGVSTACLLAVALVVVIQTLLTRTVLGRHWVAIGTNEEAVRLSGIRVAPIKVLPFVFVGAMAGVAGWFTAARMQTVDPNGGNGFELAAIAAVVIGGTSLMGGRGSVSASFLGVVLVSVLNSGLAALAVSEPFKQVITGGVIVAAVLIDVLRRRQG